MKICDSIEDLICDYCIHSSPVERYEGYVQCRYQQSRPAASLVKKDNFCGEKGEWAVKVSMSDCHWEDGKKIIDNSNEKFKILTRDYCFTALLNVGDFDW